MKRATFIALSTASVLLASCGKKEEPPAQSAVEDSMPAPEQVPVAVQAGAAQTFVNAAAASDAFEIATSRLATANSSNPKIKKFAQQMIAAHTESTAKLQAAASSVTPSITPDPTLSASQKVRVEALGKLSGEAFDRSYAEAQINAHQKALDTLKAYGASGDVPGLKSFASGAVPMVTAHLNSAKGLLQ